MDQKNTAIPTTQSGNASQRDWLLVLLAITILPCVYYGERVGLVLGVSLLSAVVGTAAFRLIRGIRDIPDLSCLTVGMIVGLMLPVNVPLFIPALASLFAVCVCREAFGGQHYVFHPAAAGLALVTVLWPETVFSYYDMKAGGGVTLWEGVCTVTQSPAASLKKGIVSDLQPFDMLFGRYAGPMGATAAVVIVAGFLFLLVRRRIDFRMPLGMLLTASAVVTMVPVCLLSSLIGQRLPIWMRPPISVVLAAALLWLVHVWQPWLLRTTGEVGCLMAVGSVMLSHASDYAPGHVLMGTLADSLGAAFGFGAVAVIVGGLRTLLAGSVWWQQGDVWGIVPSEVAAQPFFGLLLLGVLAAALQKGNQVRRKWAKRREES